MRRSILADKTSRNLFFFLCLNLSFAFVELLYGIWSNRYRGGGGEARRGAAGGAGAAPSAQEAAPPAAASATSASRRGRRRGRSRSRSRAAGPGLLARRPEGAARQSGGGCWGASPERERSRG